MQCLWVKLAINKVRQNTKKPKKGCFLYSIARTGFEVMNQQKVNSRDRLHLWPCLPIFLPVINHCD